MNPIKHSQSIQDVEKNNSRNLLRKEINEKLKMIIEHFEVGKESDVKISSDLEESSLQFI